MNEKHSGSELDGLIADWRRASGAAESLSSPARRRIFTAARGEGKRPAALASLFLPVSRLIVSAGLPAAALTLLFGVAVLPVPEGVKSDAPPSLHARKQGDEVVFVIANGGQQHRIYRSTSLAELGSGEPFATADAAFRDRIDANPGLTFYRID